MYKSARERTRDRLLEYDSVPYPRAASISPVYPWENLSLPIFSNWLYTLAKKGGYSGTMQDFYRYFGLYLEQNKQEIIFAKWEEFPEEGLDNKLYFDLDTQKLYCWNGTEYQPINAMLIANTIIEGGGA